MKKIIITPGVITVLLVMLFACSDDLLDRPGQGNLDANVLANQDGVEANLIAAYSMLDGWGNYGNWGGNASNWIFGSVASDDAYKGSEPGDQPPVTDVELYQWSTSGADGYLDTKWQVTYDGINRANATITLMREVEGISDADQRRIEGEALCLRAHYHFEAWKMWKNIPYYTEEDEDFRKTNVGTDALPLIIADLDAAINLLPEEQAEVGRVTKWTAKAIKGRVQMYQEDYSGALATLSDVVNNGPYMLEENFHNVFDVAHNNGPETILAYQASVNDGNPNGENGNRNDRLNFPHSGSPFGCCGFHQPSQNFVNVFKVDANGLPLLDGTWNDADLTPADPVDPRLDLSVGRDDVPFLDWGLHEAGWIRDRSWAGPYSPKKTIYTQESGAWSAVGWQTTQLHSLNLHLLRYADVMLLLAEAEIKAGSIENARTLINQIRERAAQGAQGPVGGPLVVPIDDASITWATYDVQPYPASGWDAATAMEALKMERRLELGMEGHRLFDLVRWGDFKEVLNDYLATESVKRPYLEAAFTVSDRHSAYPLPSVQMELSKVEGESRLVQNPGW
jgi:hypothetical protein